MITGTIIELMVIFTILGAIIRSFGPLILILLITVGIVYLFSRNDDK